MTGVDVVVERLGDIAGVTALVGTRIYALILPQSATFPAVLVKNVHLGEDMHLRGMTGVKVERVQVDHYADTGDMLSGARALADAAYGAGDATGLAAWAGSLGGSPATKVDRIEPLDRVEGFSNFGGKRQAVVSQDYQVQYRG